MKGLWYRYFIDRYRGAGGEPKGTLDRPKARKRFGRIERSLSEQSEVMDSLIARLKTVGQTGKKGAAVFHNDEVFRKGASAEGNIGRR